MAMSVEEKRDKMRQEQADAVAAGKCRSCRKPNPLAGERVMCPTCLERNAETKRNKRAARLAMGTCTYCERKPWNGHVTCRKHTLAARYATVKHRGMQAKKRKMTNKKKGGKVRVKG